MKITWLIYEPRYFFFLKASKLVVGLTKGFLRGKALSVEGHVHSASNITSGTLPIARGGTGATSAAAARSALGAAAASHTHDDRYYTESEIANLLSGKANSSHTHDASQISGILPANKGGTGVTSIDALKNVLGIGSSGNSISKIVTGSYIGNGNLQTITVPGINKIEFVIVYYAQQPIYVHTDPYSSVSVTYIRFCFASRNSNDTELYISSNNTFTVNNGNYGNYSEIELTRDFEYTYFCFGT